MLTTAYFISFLVAVAVLLFMVIYGEGYGINHILLAVVIVIGNGGYLALSVSQNIQHALLAVMLTYTIGIFAAMLLFINISEIYKVNLPNWLVCLMYIVQFVLYLASATIGTLDIFYKSAELKYMDDVVYLQKEYGPVHTVYAITIYVYFILLIACSTGVIKGKRKISSKDATLIFFLEFITISVYVAERLVGLRVELFPFVIDIAEILLLVPLTKLNTYTLTGNNEIVRSRLDAEGYVFFDKKLRFMGFNNKAAEFFPELGEWELEKKIPGSGGRFNTFLRQPLYRFLESPVDENSFGIFDMRDVKLKFKIGVIKNRAGRKRGYIIELDEVRMRERDRQ